MTLPNLPQINNQQEAKFGIAFRKWWEAHPMEGSFELKDTLSKDYLSFSDVKPQQIAYGMRIRGDKGALIRVVGLDGNPDYIGMVRQPSWIVIKFPGFFCIISVERFHLESQLSKRRSLTSARAKDISVVVIHS